MRVLVCSIGQFGHLNPMIALGRELRAAGHDVLIATGPAMAGHVTAAGLRCLPMGTGGELRKDFGTEAEGRAASLVDRQVPRWLGDLERHTARWRPDVIVRQWLEGASLVLAHRLGVPHVVCEICLRVPDWARDFDPAARTMREYGIEPEFARGALWLSCFPPSFARPGTPSLPGEHHVRPLLFDHHEFGAAADVPDGGVAGLGAGPLVYATLGTMYNQVPYVFENLIEAFAGEGYQAVITTGPDRDPAALAARSALPPNVLVARYVPHSRVIPRAAAVISHGGFSTVMSALSAGVPLGLIPLGSDHGTNAARCVELGAGVLYERCRTEPYAHTPPDDVDPALVRGMARALLEEDRYRAGADRLRHEIAGLPGAAHAVALIEAAVRPS